MRILVTGATGFVGRNLIPYLQNKISEIELMLLCRNIEAAKNLFHDAVIVDAENKDLIRSFNPEIVIHLAGFLTSSDESKDVARIIDSNFSYGVRLLDILKECDALRFFINAGSCTQYMLGEGLQSAYLYSATKTAFLSVLEYYSCKLKFKIVNPVFYTIYGPNATHKQVLDYIVQSLNSPKAIDMSPGYQMLDYIHVFDVCEFLKLLIEREKMVENKEVFHVGSGKPLNLHQLVEMVQNITGGKCSINWGGRNYRENDIMYSCAPQGHMIQKFGWQPRISLIEGLTNILKGRVDR